MKYTDLQIIKFEIGDTATFWKKSSSILYSLYYFFLSCKESLLLKDFLARLLLSAQPKQLLLQSVVCFSLYLLFEVPNLQYVYVS